MKRREQKAKRLLRNGPIQRDLDGTFAKKPYTYNDIQCAYAARLHDCVVCSAYNFTEDTVYQNATQTGLIKKLNPKQRKLLKRVSRDAEVQRLCLITGKVAGTVVITLSLITMIIELVSYNGLYQDICEQENKTAIIWLLIAGAATAVDLHKLEKQRKNIDEITKDGFKHQR